MAEVAAAHAQDKPEPPKPEELLKRIEHLEVLAGVKPPPPRKETVTAYYKTPPFKAEPEGKDESPKDKAAREARDKRAKEQAGKTVVYELPPIVYQEAKNGRSVTIELPQPVTDAEGHEHMVASKFVVPEDADAWSLEDPDKDKKGGKADEPGRPAAPAAPASRR
jgi:hypothetical protein